MKRILSLVSALVLFAGAANASRDVGIFYFAWLGQHPSEQTGNYDITKLLKDHPKDLYSTEGTALSPMHKYHFWSEPLYGYYNSADPWVITRHVELFMAAGIDYLVLDTTNGFCYPEVVRTLLNVLKAFQAQGLEVPKVSFYTNGGSGKVIRTLYDTFYKGGEYNSVWYAPEGRPMVIGVTRRNKGTTDQPHPDYIEEILTEYFDVRESQWPTKHPDDAAFPWMSWDYPQRIHNGVVSVSVAQHSTKKIIFSDLVNGRGRGYDAPTGKNIHSEVRSGHNFQNQWNTVLDRRDQVSNVFLTGWNEWVAIKYVFDGEVGFVDTFNEEFSRDIEMMKGGYADNFYIQMARNISSFKGTEPSLITPVADASGKAVFTDPKGDAMVRDFIDFCGKGRYTDNSARNDIVRVTVSHDATSVSFRITTAEPVTPHMKGDKSWMNILVQTTDTTGKAFPYDFIIGRNPSSGKTSVERTGSAGLRNAGKATLSVSGNEMVVTVPLKVLGLSPASVNFSFKVADHVSNPMDIMDYYISGDSAPVGRLSYRYSWTGNQ